MAKKQATKSAAKPAAKPAKKAAAPPVTMKEIEESNLFDEPEIQDTVKHDGGDDEKELEEALKEASNLDTDVELKPENGENAMVRDKIIEKQSEFPWSAKSEEEIMPEPASQLAQEPASDALLEQEKEREAEPVENIITGKDQGEPSLPEDISFKETPAETHSSPASTPSQPVASLNQQETPSDLSTPSMLGQKDNIAGMDLDDESIFESSADLEEIFSAMEDVKKDEAQAIATAVAAIESGQNAANALKDLSSDVADKIQKQLEERSLAEEEVFVTEEDFIQHARNSLSKTWYHCLYFLAFESESGTATKKVLYDALKEVLSKSPVDSMPEHMFNFGLSALVKVMLYDKPVISFKKGEFSLETNRKKLQELLLTAGMPMSRRPVVTRKEEKKMISDFFDNDKLF